MDLQHPGQHQQQSAPGSASASAPGSPPRQQQRHQGQAYSPKKNGRPRASSRAGGPSSSSGNHHPYDGSPGSGSLTNIFNPEVESPASLHAPGPAIRARGKHTPSQSRSHKQTSSSPASTDISSSATPNMDTAPRPERAPRQGLGHSFTFATPQPNTRHASGRKRARTLEFPSDSGAAEDDAKVKGGHSLRKRARIDYAQMNDDDADKVPPPSTEEPLEITVSGARAARKRRPAVLDTSFDHQDESQAQSATLPPKRKGRGDKQRTASPVPQRRPYPKRKSTAPAAPVDEPSPEQQPSDTELKDTIEVGVAMQFDSSPSNSLPSETASNNSAQSPSRSRISDQPVLPQDQVASPTAMRPEAEAEASPGKVENSAPEEAQDDSLRERVTSEAQAHVGSPKSQVDGEETKTEDKQGQPSNLEDGADESTPQLATPIVPAVNESGSKSTPPIQEPRNFEAQTPPKVSQVQGPASFQTIDSANFSHSATDSERVPQSSPQGSVDSDATEIISPKEMILNKPAANPSQTERPTGQQSRVTLTRRSKQAHAESQKQDPTDGGAQESQKPSLRPRRRLNRIAEDSAATEQEAQLPKEQPSASKKADGRSKATNRSAHSQEMPQPTSPDTPKKRGPGRPPKIRLSIEQEPPKPKERRASKTVIRMEQPRPIRSHPPRDFSFLVPYLDSREAYPEISQDSGVPTPLETPTLRTSEAVDEQVEGSGSKEPDSQEPQPGLDGEMASNAPTPGPVSEMPTPGPESAAPSRAASPEPVVEPMRRPKQRKQYSFPRIRSPTEFINILEDHKNMSDEDLYNILAQSTNALVTWQEEWKQQKMITEDEDNAVRRRAHDAALMAREARDLAKTNGSVTVEKRDFEVKGLRADKANEKKYQYPSQNPEAYERYQDQVAAQAWGFEWDPRPSMIARQDPIAQRDGLQNTRLRNRPKLSQRAAEAAGDEPVGIVPGKRTRRPRLLSDGSNEDSRAPTPVEPPANPRKRRRRRNADGELESDHEAGTQQAEVQPEPAPVQEPTPRKKRGPKPKAVKEAEARAAAEREAAETAAQEAAAQEAAAQEAAAQEAAAQEAAAQEAAAQEAAAQEAAAQEAAAAIAAALAQPAQPEAGVEQSVSRKRRRGVAAPAVPEIASYDVPTASIEDIQHQGSAQTGLEEGPVPKRRRGGRKSKMQIPPEAFYGSASNAPAANSDAVTPVEEKRPSTSSSTSSMRTVGSSYSFRNRTRKNYSELADPINQVLGEPRPRRGRKHKNRQEDPEPTSYPSSLRPAPSSDGPQHPPGRQARLGYPSQPTSVLAPPNNPFINVTGGGPGPGPLLAPSPVRPGHVAAPQSVGANPFSAPSNLPIEPPPHGTQSPAPRKIVKIKLNTNKGKQSATPQPPSDAAPPPQRQQGFPLAPLQPPSNFLGHTGYEPSLFGGPTPLSFPGAGPGQAMFPLNASQGSMSMPPMLQNAPTLPPLGSNIPSGFHDGSLPPDSLGSGRGTPVPSSNTSANGGMGPDGDELSEKDYASMTKSEKMSASMKARWANGSMRQAVNKRKETLARKKQKVSDDKTTTPTPQPESAPPSVHSQDITTTPPSLPPLGLPALPEAIAPIPLPPQQQQQPPHGYEGMLHNPFKHDDGRAPGRGVILPPAHTLTGPGPMAPQHFHEQQEYRPQQPPLPREPVSQNPFLDNGYAGLYPRLPFSNGDFDERNGRFDHGGPGHGWGQGM